MSWDIQTTALYGCWANTLIGPCTTATDSRNQIISTGLGAILRQLLIRHSFDMAKLSLRTLQRQFEAAKWMREASWWGIDVMCRWANKQCQLLSVRVTGAYQSHLNKRRKLLYTESLMTGHGQVRNLTRSILYCTGLVQVTEDATYSTCFRPHVAARAGQISQSVSCNLINDFTIDTFFANIWNTSDYYFDHIVNSISMSKCTVLFPNSLY